MARGDLLTRTEEVVLTSVAELATTSQAFGMSIFERCQQLTKGRYISIGSIYTILDRLQQKGLVESWFEESKESETHSAKRCFRITEAGIEAIREVARLNRALKRAWNIIPIPQVQPGERRLSVKKAADAIRKESDSRRAS